MPILADMLMRLVLIAGLGALGCGAVEAELNESTATSADMLIPSCGSLECDGIHCTTCYACPGIPSGTTTCECGWWGVPAEDNIVCEPDGKPAPDPF